MDELVRKIEFVELAASADFQDHFIYELGFETGEGFYPPDEAAIDYTRE